MLGTTLSDMAPATNGPRSSEREARRFRWLRPPLHPLLLAAYAVLFLFAENMTEVSVAEVLPPLGWALATATMLALISGLILRDPRRGALVASALILFWFGYGHLDLLLRPAGTPRDMELAVWGAFLVTVASAAYLLRDRWIGTVTRVIDALAVTLVGLTLLQVMRAATVPGGGPAPSDGAPATPGAPRRDIYFIVWDRYGSEEAVGDLGAGRDELADRLASRGFAVVRQAHANYGRTVLSLAATLNMTTLDEVSARMGPTSDDLAPIQALLQTHAVGRYLRSRGYRYVHIGSWFAPTRTVAIADENLTMPEGTDFEAALDATTLRPTLDALLDVPRPPAHDVLHRTTALWQLRAFDEVRRQPGPKFVMLHVLLPHEPYVFDEAGDYPSDAERTARGEAENYRQQMVFVNDQIERMVDQLLEGPPDLRPIIIVAGDEGPFPIRYAADQTGFDWTAATDTELETKYGVLLAFHLPDGPAASGPLPYPTMSSWNTFRLILSRYLDAGLPLLPDRSFTSRRWDRPYDLTDVTHRLPAPYGASTQEAS